MEPSPETSQPRAELAIFPGFLTTGYRFMYEKLSEKSAGMWNGGKGITKIHLALVMNQHIMTVGSAIAAENGFADQIGNPGQSAQDAIRTFGRICSETDARMNEKSIILECSRQIGNGCRIPLDLSKIPSYALFPGQVGMEG